MSELDRILRAHRDREATELEQSAEDLYDQADRLREPGRIRDQQLAVLAQSQARWNATVARVDAAERRERTRVREERIRSAHARMTQVQVGRERRAAVYRQFFSGGRQ